MGKFLTYNAFFAHHGCPEKIVNMLMRPGNVINISEMHVEQI